MAKSDVVMVLGAPASGKSSLSEGFIQRGYEHLNRDKAGGSVAALAPQLDSFISAGKNVVLDNLFATAESRKPFLDVCKKQGVRITCSWMKTSIEDSIINALHRMWKRHGKIFFDPESLKGVKDPNMFPICVFFKYKKEFEPPKTDEGFASITSQAFTRIYDPAKTVKAVIVDYDGTLREVNGGEYKYPVKPSEVKLMRGRKEKLQEMKKKGYIILGASNQSGIAKKHLTSQDATDCFQKTNDLLGIDIPFVSCPHSVPPSCYCRKPQSGMGVYMIEKYNLDPRQCLFIGDQTTDKTFAERLGMTYHDQAEFFGG